MLITLLQIYGAIHVLHVQVDQQRLVVFQNRNHALLCAHAHADVLLEYAEVLETLHLVVEVLVADAGDQVEAGLSDFHEQILNFHLLLLALGRHYGLPER